MIVTVIINCFINIMKIIMKVKPDVLDIIASMGPRTAGRNQITPPDSGRQPGMNILLVLITNICKKIIRKKLKIVDIHI